MEQTGLVEAESSSSSFLISFCPRRIRGQKSPNKHGTAFVVWVIDSYKLSQNLNFILNLNSVSQQKESKSNIHFTKKIIPSISAAGLLVRSEPCYFAPWQVASTFNLHCLFLFLLLFLPIWRARTLREKRKKSTKYFLTNCPLDLVCLALKGFDSPRLFSPEFGLSKIDLQNHSFPPSLPFQPRHISLPWPHQFRYVSKHLLLSITSLQSLKSIYILITSYHPISSETR